MKTSASEQTLQSGIPLLPLVLYAVLVFCVIATGIYFYTSQVESIRADAGSRLQSISELKRREIREWRAERFGDAKVVISNPYTLDRIERLISSPPGVDSGEDLREYLLILNRTFGYKEIQIINKEGVVLLSTSLTPFCLQPQEMLDFRESLKHQEVQFFDIYANDLTKQPHLLLFAPIFKKDTSSELTSEFQACLVFEVDPEVFLFPLIQMNPSPTETGETVLVRRDGNDVVYLNRLRHRSDPPLTFRLPILGNEDLPAVKAVTGTVGIVSSKDYRNVKVMGYIYPVAESRWFLLTKVDEKEVLAPLKGIVWTIFSSVIGLILLLGISILFWLKRKEAEYLLSKFAAEEALRKNQSLLYETQRIAKVGGWDYDLVARRVTWTDEIYNIFGVTKDYDPNNIERNFSFCIPEDEQRTAEAFQRISETGESYDLELKLISVPGQEKWVRSIGFAERKDGKIIRIYGIIMDITERKLSEEVLRKNQSILNESQRIAKVGGWDYDIINHCVTWTDEIYRIFGVTKDFDPNDVEGNFLFFSPEDRSQTAKSFHRLAETGEPYDLVQRLTLAQGHSKWVRSIGFAERKEGIITRLYGIIMDITEHYLAEKEREHLYAEIARKNKELEDVIYAASHDLRTPLVNMVGFTQVIEKAVKEFDSNMSQLNLPAEVQKAVEPLLKERLNEPLHFIMSSTVKMDTLIGGLLRLSRLGRATLQKEELDMNHLLSEIAKTMAFLIQEAEGEIIIDSLPACNADAGLINQVVSNLLDNAIKYRSPSRPLKIRVNGFIREQEVVYCIEDNGVGIPEDRLETVWRLFYRLDNRANVSGEGLGLALVRRIVERHGGRVWDESEPDHGSRFYFALPIKGCI